MDAGVLHLVITDLTSHNNTVLRPCLSTPSVRTWRWILKWLDPRLLIICCVFPLWSHFSLWGKQPLRASRHSELSQPFSRPPPSTTALAHPHRNLPSSLPHSQPGFFLFSPLPLHIHGEEQVHSATSKQDFLCFMQHFQSYLHDPPLPSGIPQNGFREKINYEKDK